MKPEGKEELIKKIKDCKTIPALDGMRKEVVQTMIKLGQSGYQGIQNVFRKQKNKLLRIPRSERTW